MTSKQLFQYSLALPLIPPILMIPLWFLRESINENSAFAFVPIFIAYSGIVGGIPYVILALTLLIWMRNKELASIRQALLASPALMLPIFAACLGLYSIAFERDSSLREYLFGLVFFSAFVIIFGYAYVGIVFGVEKLVRGKLRN